MIQVGMSSPVSYDLQGQGGGIVINAGGSVNGNFRWIQGITDFQIQAISSSNITNASLLAGNNIPAGVGIGGRFTSIQLDSGIAIAYYA
jgi:hypothetical protein